jgi:hypothetical protein
MTESEFVLFIVAISTQPMMLLPLAESDLQLQKAPGQSNAEASTNNNKFGL